MPRIEASELIKGRPWPVLEVELEVAGKGKASLYAILDSGADTSIIPFEVIEPSGLKWADLTPAASGTGVGGKVEQRLLDGTLRWRTWDICHPVRVAQPKRLKIALLGRDDFFKLFVVRFNWHRTPPDFQVDPIVSPGRKVTRAGAKSSHRGRRKRR